MKGDRQIPVLSMTSEGLPYIRLSRNQPPVLSRSIGRKLGAYRKAVNTITTLEEHGVEDAILEDQWEKLVAIQMRKEGISKGNGSSSPEEALNSFGGGVLVNRLWWEFRIARIWQDWMARGDALHRLVQEQRDLAATEKGEPAQLMQETLEPKLLEGQPLSIGVQRERTFLFGNQRSHTSTTGKTSSAGDHSFDSTYWVAMVQSQGPRLLRRYSALQREWLLKRQHLHEEWESLERESRKPRH